MNVDQLPSTLRGLELHGDEQTLSRAHDLFRRGGVQLLLCSDRAVAARVGSLPFRNVHVLLGDREVSGSCDCQAGRPCEHVWALMFKLARDTSVLDRFDPVARDRTRRWKGTLADVAARQVPVRESRTAAEPLWYVLVPGRGGPAGASVAAGRCKTLKSGELRFQALRGETAGVPAGVDDVDRTLLLMLAGATEDQYTYRYTGPGSYDLPLEVCTSVLGELCRSGRLLARKPECPEDLVPLTWSALGYEAVLAMRRRDDGGIAAVVELVQGDERLAVPQTGLQVHGSVVVRDRTMAPLADPRAAPWVAAVAARPFEEIRNDELDDFLREVVERGGGLALEIEDDVGPRVLRAAPRARLVFEKGGAPDGLEGALWFDYDEVAVRGENARPFETLPRERLIVQRDAAAEAAWAGVLDELGLKQVWLARTRQTVRWLPSRRFASVVSQLIARGVHVQAEGVVYRKARGFSTSVSSATDWFDVKGAVDFDGTPVPFPRILRALRKQERLVDLGDGAFGMLPDEWLARFRLLDELGTVQGDHLRFQRCQLGMLDELLGGEAGATFDDGFAKARAELAQFDGIVPLEPPATFTGELRPYQKEGLAWLAFLERFGFGGCLADDMGLGKTVQVIAYLAGNAGLAKRKPGRPPKNAPAPVRRTALVVVPRSLAFNWFEEARRFAPGLTVLSHVGLGRATDGATLLAHDLVITTYGTLRRDVELLASLRFDTVVLDEAQAIKNATTDAARAARRLQARCRIALSGTPIENHLGELVSLMDFLNPGLFGSHPLLARGSVKSRPQDRELAQMLRGVLRPFLLRRTKAAVAPQLPARTEQTLHCDLEPEQRKLYDELREHYRTTLLAPDRALSGGQEKLLVLEALLRLRQVACHPGLADPKRKNLPSAKLELLVTSLAEVLDEGHKVLVFSQFTSMLAIVRERLERGGIVHEYLDGQTRDRASRVRRFQEDPSVKVFLISLRAGGLGLNLTAADYVYILDPWWNPAVEAQAIDRAHRIGQQRAVIAYRLVARDTVEERILDLQATKRDLADAILSEDAGPLARLSRDDLAVLLG